MSSFPARCSELRTAKLLWDTIDSLLCRVLFKDELCVNLAVHRIRSPRRMNSIVGNFGEYIVTSQNVSTTNLFIGFAVDGFIGVAILCCLRQPAGEQLPQVERGKVAAVRQSRIQEAWLSAIAALRLFLDSNTQLLLPIYFFSGFEMSFQWGEFTQMLPQKVIGLVMTFAGVGEVIGGYTMGSVTNRFGRSATMTLASISYATGLGLTALLRAAPDGSGPMLPPTGGAPLAAYFAAVLLGFGDSGFQAICFGVCNDADEEDAHAVTGTSIGGSTRSIDSGFSTSETKKLLPDDGPTSARSLSSGVSSAAAAASPQLQTQEGSSSNPESHAKAAAYTIFQLVQNVGLASGFAAGIVIPLHDSPVGVTPKVDGSYVQCYVQSTLLSLSLILVIAYEVRRRRRATLAATMT